MNPPPSLPKSKIAVVIPCYRVKGQILEVLKGIPSWVDSVFAIDDCCPQLSGKYLEKNCSDSRLTVIYHEANSGVGGATTTGYRAALNDRCEIIIKMDGDDQMDPAYLERLVRPILIGHADFTKGNRFYDLYALRQMPLTRRIGNLGLTLLTKAVSGYWNVADPTNGYTAVHASALSMLSLDRLSNRYFFETSMLVQLNIVRAMAHDVPIPARYGNEESSLSIGRALFGFPPRLMLGFIRRILWRYFIHDLSAVTVLLVAGSILTFFGIGFGSYSWIQGSSEARYQSAGTVALAILPTILGFQMLLQAVMFDVMDRPTIPLHKLLQIPSRDAPAT